MRIGNLLFNLEKRKKLTAPHDYLPLIKIVQGAGGIMTEWEGNNLNFSDKNVYVLASSSNRLHELALEKLRAEWNENFNMWQLRTRNHKYL